MKIVIISRTMYPKNAPRSMRTTNLAQELSRQRHDVTVYAVLGSYDYTSFEKEHNLTIKNLGPTKWAKLNSDANQPRSNFMDKALTKILNKPIEYPDLELMFKTYNVLKKESNIDLLITIAVPFPIHWGAALFKSKHKKRFPKTWVADCGDPYMGNAFYKRPFYFKYVEKWFCKRVDFISVPVEKAKKAYYKEFRDKLRVIPQGFDFDLKHDKENPQNTIPTFIYAGGFNQKFRDPRPFINYLMTSTKEFKFIIYTRSTKLLAPYVQPLKGKMELRDYIPRDELIQKMKKADFLVNIENLSDVQTPSKLIDYAIAGRPILSVSQKEKEYKIVDEFLNGNYENQLKIKNISQYHISSVAKSFLNLAKQ